MPDSPGCGGRLAPASLAANLPAQLFLFISGVELIFATDLQTRLAVARLHDIINATWGLLGGEGLFVPLISAYLFWWV